MTAATGPRMRMVIAAVATLALGAIVYGFTLPSGWHVERSLQMQAPRAKVFALVGSLQRWPEWAMPPEIQPEEATDTLLRWAGGGRIEITELVPNESVRYEVRYTGSDRPMKGKITLTGETTVQWSDDGEAGSNPVARYFINSVVRDVGNDMQQGLERLKARVETP